MPRKVFVAGEILTAADVNTNLMDQAVMVFDSSTARGSAIPSPSEGMVTYLKDTDALEKYTTAWEPVDTGGLLATHYVQKTDTFSASVGAGGNVAVTGLSISNVALSNASNKLIITAFFGAAATNADRSDVGIAVSNGTSLLSIGASPSSRTAVTAGGPVSASTGNFIVTMPHITIVYEPGDTTARTYTVHAVNVKNATQTLYVNRNAADGNDASQPRAVSALLIEEVAV